MYSNGRSLALTPGAMRALLIHNNPFLEDHLHTTLPSKMLIDISPVRLNETDIHFWSREQTPLQRALDGMRPPLRDMFEQAGAETTHTMATLASYFVAGGSGYAEAGKMSASSINALTRDLNDELVKKLGKKKVCSLKGENMAKIGKYLKNHPKYLKLMEHLQKLPNHLLPKAKLSPLYNTNVAIGRNFRKHVTLPLRKWHNPSRYVNTMVRQLNGRLKVLKSAGRHATWYVPAVLGVASVATASPDERVRTIFEEGFGILGGAFGTKLGGAFGGFLAISALGLGPLGLFVTVFICASLGGIALMESGKKVGSAIYDFGSHLSIGQIYNSPEQFLESIK